VLLAVSISPAQADHTPDPAATEIKQGLQSFAQALGGLENLDDNAFAVNEFGDVIPFTETAPTDDAGLSLAKVFEESSGASLNEQLGTRTFHSTAELESFLDDPDGNSDPNDDGAIAGVGIDFEAGITGGPTVYDITLTLTLDRQNPTQLFLEDELVEVKGGTVNVDYDLATTLAFRLDTAAAIDRFYLRTDAGAPAPNVDVRYSAAGNFNSSPIPAEVGILEVDTAGTAAMAADWNARILDPDSNQRVTKAELETTASVDLFDVTYDSSSATLDLDLTSDDFGGLSGLTGTIDFTDGNLSNGIDPAAVHAGIDLGGLGDFRNVTPQDFIAGLGQVAMMLQALESAGDARAKFPFLQMHLTDAVKANEKLIKFFEDNGLMREPPETGAECDNSTDDDGDALANDGCPIAGTVAESGSQCNDETDAGEDLPPDAKVNDGCPSKQNPLTIDLGDPGDPTTIEDLNTVQEIMDAFAAALGAADANAIGLSYDPAAKRLDFDVDVCRSSACGATGAGIPATLPAEIDFADQLEEIGIVDVSSTEDASASVAPQYHLDLGVGVSFSPAADPDNPPPITERYSVETQGTEFEANTPAQANLDQVASLGFLEVSLSDHNASGPINLLAGRSSDSGPMFEIDIDDGTADNRMTLAEVFDGLNDDPDVSGDPVLADILANETDIVNMAVPTFRLLADASIGGTSLASGQVQCQLADVTDPDIDSSGPSCVTNAKFNRELLPFNFDEDNPDALLGKILNGVQTFCTKIESLATSTPALRDKLPLINSSFAELAGQCRVIVTEINKFVENPAASLQRFEELLENKLAAAIQDVFPGANIENTDFLEIELDTATTSILFSLKFGLCSDSGPRCNIVHSLEVPFNLATDDADELSGIVGVGANGTFELDYSAIVTLDFGVGLALVTPPTPGGFRSIEDINPDSSDSADVNGASGGRVNGLATVANDNDTFYAASEYGGLFKSEDGGDEWQRLDRHLPTTMWDVEVDPSNAQKVYATSLYDGLVNTQAGVNVSSDGGQTWTHPTLTPAGTCPAIPASGYEPSAFGIDIEPGATQNVYIGTNCGLAVSSNGGTSWTVIDPTPATPPSIVYDVVAHSGGTIDVCGDDGHLRSPNRGANWGTASAGIPSGRCFLAGSPDESYVLFAAASDNTIYEIDDADAAGGGTWTSLGSPEPGRFQGRTPFVQANQRSNSGGNNVFDLWFGDISLFRAGCTTPAARPNPDVGSPRCPAGNAAAGAGAVPAGWAGPFTRTVGAHDDAGDLVFDTEAGNDACPLIFSSDGGVHTNTDSSADCHNPNWQRSNEGLHGLWLWSMAGADRGGGANEDLYLGLQDDGTFATRNAGAGSPDWTNPNCCDTFDLLADDIAPRDFVLGTTCCFLPPNPPPMNRIEKANPGYAGKALLGSNPPGGLPLFSFGKHLVQLGDKSVAAVTPNGVSTTNDVTVAVPVWTPIEALPAAAVQPCALYVGSEGGTDTFYVQAEPNGVFPLGCRGVTSDHIYKHVGTGTTGWTRIDNNDGLAGGFGVFAVDRNDPDRLYASHIGGADPHMVFSTDGGTNWEVDTDLDDLMAAEDGSGNARVKYRVQNGITDIGTNNGFEPYFQPSLLAYDPQDGNIIVAGGRDSGVFLSKDGGANWILLTDPLDPANSGTPHLPRPRHAYFDHEPGSLDIYIGTQGRGVWRITPSNDDLGITPPAPPPSLEPTVFIRDTSSVELDVNLIANFDLTARIGPFSIFVGKPTQQAQAKLGASFTLKNDVDNDGEEDRIGITSAGIGSYFSGLLPGGFSFRPDTQVSCTGISGTFDGCASLPIFISTSNPPIGTVAFTAPNIMDPSTWDVDVPDDMLDELLAQALDLGVILNGLQEVLKTLEKTLAGASYNARIPVIGQSLDAGADITRKFREEIIVPLTDFVETLPQPNDEPSELRTALQGFFVDNLTGDDLNLLVDSNGDGDKDADDVTIVLMCDDGEPATRLEDTDGDPDTPDEEVPNGDGADGPTACVDTHHNNIHLVSAEVQLSIGQGAAGSTVPFDVGFPGLRLSTDEGISAEVGWEVDLNFGVSKDDGFFLRTNNPIDSDAPEVTVHTGVDFPDTIKGEIALLRLGITDCDRNEDGDPTAYDENGDEVACDPDDNEIELGLSADITGGTGGKLKLTELSGGANPTGFTVKAAGEVDLNLGLATTADLPDEVGINLPDGALPTLKTNFQLNWSFGAGVGTNENPGAGGAALSTFATSAAPTIRFNHLRLDLGSFIDDFLGPMLQEVQRFTKPLQPVIDLISTPIPGISDLAKLAGQPPVTLITLFEAAADSDLTVVKRIIQLVSFINALPSDASGLPDIPIGNFGLSESVARGQPLSGDQSENLIDALDKTVTADGDDILGGFGSVGLNDDIASAQSQGGFSFPAFQQPASLFGLILGKDVTLVRWDAGKLKAEFGFSQTFGPIPVGPVPVSIVISGAAGIEGRFAIGYDTKGIRDAVAAFKADAPIAQLLGDIGLLFNGIFIDDNDANGKDVPEISLYAEFAAGAAVDLVAISVGVEGGLRATILMNLHDGLGNPPDPATLDGKLRIDEVISRIHNPICLFDVSGQLDAFIRAFVKIGFGWFSKTFRITIVKVTLLKLKDITAFCFEPPRPVLAHIESNTLVLHMGAFKSQRNFQDGEDGQPNVINERMTVRQLNAAGTKFSVSGFGFEQEYSNASALSIFADGGDGEDAVLLESGSINTVNASGEVVATEVEFDRPAVVCGGTGEDRITGGKAGDTLNGDGAKGSGLNCTTGEQGADGEDSVNGRAGNDTINGQGGPDKLSGEEGNDSINGGTGDDEVIGGPGADPVLRGGPNTIADGQTDADTIQGGPEFDPDKSGSDAILPGASVDTIFGGADMDSIESEFDGDTIWGGPSHDDLRGGKGNDIINGEAGNDVLGGAEGNDTLNGGDNIDDLFGDAGNDILNGGDGDDDLVGDVDTGGATGDTLNGGLGNDRLIGDQAKVEGPSTASTDTTVTPTGNFVGNDILSGGDNNDLMYGQDGNDTMNGDGGNDRMFGSYGADVMSGGDETPVGTATNDRMFGDAGIDTMHGNNGNDLMRGGIDGDTMNGNAGIDTMFGDSGVDTMNGGDDGDFMYGGINGDVMKGNSGNDEMHGEADADNMQGNAGSDLMSGEDANDNIVGGSSTAGAVDDETDHDGNGATPEQGDTIHGNVGADVIAGDNAAIDPSTRAVTLHDLDSADETLSGNDFLFGDEDEDRIYGGGADDTIEGNAAGDYVEGNGGGDNISGNADEDDLIGGTAQAAKPDGADTIHGNDAIDHITGDNALITRNSPPTIVLLDVDCAGDGVTPPAGASAGDFLFGDAANDVMYGQDGDDEMHGNAGADYMEGNKGHDFMEGNADADDMVGGSGQDAGDANCDGSPAGSVRRLAGAVDANTVAGSDPTAGDQMYGGTESDPGAADADDHMAGDNAFIDRTTRRLAMYDVDFSNDSNSVFDDTSGDDYMRGNGGADLMLGQRHNDTMFGDGETDYMEGNEGHDWMEGNAAADDMVGGSGQDYGGPSDALRKLEAAVDENTSQGSDPTAGDQMYGNGEADSNAGDDGGDRMTGDNAYIEQSAPNAHKIELYDVLQPGDETAPLADASGDDYMRGNGANDVMYGQGHDDTMFGDDGDDYMEGNSDHDVMEGNADEDDMLGGSGHDDGGDPFGTMREFRNVLDVGDDIQGNSGVDYMGGDNGLILRTGTTKNFDDASEGRQVELYDLQLVGGAAISPLVSGGDTMTGDEGNDVMFGQGNGSQPPGQADPDDGLDNDRDGREDGNPNDAADLGYDCADDTQGSTFLNEPDNDGDTFVDGADPECQAAVDEDADWQGDLMHGNGGHDYMEGNHGADWMFGDEHEDDMAGGGSANDGHVTNDAGDFIDDREGTNLLDRQDVMRGNGDDDTMLGDNGAVTRPLNGSGAWTKHSGSGFEIFVRSTTMNETPEDDAAAGNDFMLGNDGHDDMFGQRRDDYMQGNGGEDAMVGDLGNITDSIVGGTGSGMFIDINPPFLEDFIDVPGTLRREVELFADETGEGADGDDIILGNEGDDKLHGAAGNDLINGNGDSGTDPNSLEDGEDYLFGGDGDDAMWGGPGHDHGYGGWGMDYLDVAPRPYMDINGKEVDGEEFPADTPEWFEIAGEDNMEGIDYNYGGHDPDALQANFGKPGPRLGDRLIDAVGNANVFYVCKGAYGEGVINRDELMPDMRNFLVDLSGGDGAFQPGTPGTSGFRELSLIFPGEESGPVHPDGVGHFTCPPSDPASAGLSLSSAAVTAGDSVTITARVRNEGEAAAGQVVVRFSANGKEIGRQTIEGIAEGATEEASLAWNTTNLNGEQRIDVTIDPDNAIVDENETNNTATAILTIAGTDVAIAPADLKLSRTNIVQGDKVTVTATVHNTSSAPARDVTVRFTDNDALIGKEQTIASIPAGGTATASVVWRTHSVSGQRTLAVTVDAANAIAELDEANNAATAVVNVTPNKVKNGSYELSANGAAPDAWTASSSTATSYVQAADGDRNVTAMSSSFWLSESVPVAPGATCSVGIDAWGGMATLSVKQYSSTGRGVGTTSFVLQPEAALTEYSYPVTIDAKAATATIMLIGGINGVPTGFDTAQLSGAC
jgi:Ca2+-binding RTX toxin-like protein